MKLFPVTESTLSAAKLGEFLNEVYHLDGPVSCRLFRTGINHLYMVTSGTRKSVFRVYTFQWRSRAEIEEEIRLLRFVYLNGVAVSVPIADANRNFIQEIQAPEGVRFGVMFSFAEGRKIPKFGADIAYQIGITMARLHQLTENYRVERTEYTMAILMKDSFNRCQSFFGAENREIQFLYSIGDVVNRLFDEHSQADLRKGAVHLDIWFDNLHIDEGNVVLFDFDFSGNGFLVLDIGYFLYQLYFTNPVEKEYDEKAEAFLSGYQSIVQLSASEKQLIPAAGLAVIQFYLGVQCDRFDNWSNVFLNEDHLKRFTGMMKRWMEKTGISLNEV